MAERYALRIDGDDTVAAAQILACIARPPCEEMPDRHEKAIKVLNHWYWANHRKAGGEMPKITFPLEKPGRLVGPMLRLQEDCLTAFRAGAWLQFALLKEAPHHWFNSCDVGVTALATDRVGMENRGNEITRVWSRRKPVLHLCLAAGNALGRHHRERGWNGFGLTGAMLQPSWVNEAIEQSEDWARTILRLSKPWPTIRFYRD